MLARKKLKKISKGEPLPLDISDIEIEELDDIRRGSAEKGERDFLYPLLKDDEPIEKILEEVFKELPPEVRDKFLEEKIEEVRLGGKETARKFFESLIQQEEGKKAVEKVIERKKKSGKTAKEFFSFE